MFTLKLIYNTDLDLHPSGSRGHLYGADAFLF